MINLLLIYKAMVKRQCHVNGVLSLFRESVCDGEVRELRAFCFSRCVIYQFVPMVAVVHGGTV